MKLVRLAQVDILASPHEAHFAPGGKHLICAGSGLWLYDLAGKVVHTFQKSSGYNVGPVFVTGGSLIAKRTSVIRRWKVKTRVQDAELEPKALGYHVLMSASADGKRVLTATRSKWFTVWDLRTGAELVTWKEKKSFVIGAVLSADGTRVVHGGTDGGVHFFDVASKAPFARAQNRGWIEVVARSDDGRFFASAGRAGLVSIWKPDGTLHRTLTQGATVLSLVFSPDGELLVAHGSHGSPIIWDVASGKRLATIEDYEPKGLLGGTRTVRFSADGKRIVTMGNDCRAIVSKIEK